ncbi:NAD-dependent epimerase/dehydratase family protein [Ruania alba]|uniref:Nucleoside-diphosphate-sugar epimerase n=1 Tax=Ruania alba TaxID=648782 RepID=A0A1H5LAN6_9MICO|nr:NAD(P)-dependent oxidoreductase [Ruania alba]SEE73421.1 Nucleoside-diphosphate-sugar epimerase [Ruania alba]
MSRVVVIGGSGHVGTYLVPRLVEAGHQVVSVSRGRAVPYTPHAAWGRVEQVVLDRDATERDGTFGTAIAALEPDVVVDLICFTPDSARELVEALRGRVQHLVHCGTIWVYGHNATVPATEDQPLNPFGSYGTQKAAIETYLLEEARRTGFPTTVVRPGHICGPGWVPLNPAGHFDPGVFSLIARGEELVLPNLGLETVHHVHADDVAQIVERAIAGWGAAVGEAFNAVSPQAVNLRGYAEHMSRWFGHEPRLAFQPFEQWRTTQDPGDADATLDHISRSPSHSIEKARRLLGHVPRYSSFAAVEEAVARLIADGRVQRA